MSKEAVLPQVIFGDCFLLFVIKDSTSRSRIKILMCVARRENTIRKQN